MNKNIFSIFVIISVIALFGSCHSTKKVEKETSKLLAVDSVFIEMKDHQFQYNWFVGKFSAEYKDGENKQSFSGQFRIRKDSAIWMSIYAVMNIEVFRVIITQDSVKLLNRIKKTYYQKPISFLNQQLNTDIDFDILQSLLIGSDFNYYENNKFTLSLNENRYKLSTVSRGKLKKHVKSTEDLEKVLIQNMWIDRDNYKITKQNVRQVKNPNKKVVADYSDFQDIEGQPFPFETKFKIIGEKTISLDVNYRSVIINKPQSFPFRVPSKYSRQ